MILKQTNKLTQNPYYLNFNEREKNSVNIQINITTNFQKSN